MECFMKQIINEKTEFIKRLKVVLQKNGMNEVKGIERELKEEGFCNFGDSESNYD